MTAHSKAQNFVEILIEHACKQPNQRAFVYLEDKAIESGSLTYAELHLRACAIATQLLKHHGKGERVILLYPPGLDFVAGFMGCLYAGAIAVPTYPPSPKNLKRTLPRFRAVVSDSKPRIVLTTAKTAIIAKPLSLLLPEFYSVKWLATDHLDLKKYQNKSASEFIPPSIEADTLAFIQYTSGSTAAPKGVMVSHENLIHNSKEIYRMARHDSKSVYVSWLPTYHDMGLIGGILQPLYGGFLGVLLSPITFLKHPLAWLQAIDKYRGTTSPFPNFALELCIRKITADQRKKLDLNCWTIASNGSETVQPETLKRFTEVFAPYGFKDNTHHPCYGLSEGTLLVTGLQDGPRLPYIRTFNRKDLACGRVVESLTENTEDKSCSLVSCGQSLPDQRIVIVNPDTQIECAPNQVGEIWISGPSVTLGYWDKKAETEKVFHARLAQSTDACNFLRTGDLGFLWENELFITGRIKDVIIIRGRNIYPQDIEQTVLNTHPSLRPGCCAAFSYNLDDVETASVVAEFEPARVLPARVDTMTVIKTIRSAVYLDHDIDLGMIALIKTGTIPKTSSGKIQRHAVRKCFEQGTLVIHTKWEKEKKLER